MNIRQEDRETYPDPIHAALSQETDFVLAVISGTEGPSYRPLGAVMAVLADGRRIGTLSSGCIEKDIALHALETLNSGTPKRVRYGRGSPFIDIKLPCGGGLDILLVPRPDRPVLRRVTESRAARVPCTLCIAPGTGRLSFSDHGATGPNGEIFRIRFLPEFRFLVFGKGPEAGTFAALVQSAGYPNLLLSPDRETTDHAAIAGCEVRHLTKPGFPTGVDVDPYTAIVLFFHDHDWEPPILASAATTLAFYMGAQGSTRSRETRDKELAAMGLERDAIDRLRGPIGLIPATRDARTLAVSVLAEVLAVAARVFANS